MSQPHYSLHHFKPHSGHQHNPFNNVSNTSYVPGSDALQYGGQQSNPYGLAGYGLNQGGSAIPSFGPGFGIGYPPPAYNSAPSAGYMYPPQAAYSTAPPAGYMYPPQTAYSAAAPAGYEYPPQTAYAEAPPTGYEYPPQTEYATASPTSYEYPQETYAAAPTSSLSSSTISSTDPGFMEAEGITENGSGVMDFSGLDTEISQTEAWVNQLANTPGAISTSGLGTTGTTTGTTASTDPNVTAVLQELAGTDPNAAAMLQQMSATTGTTASTDPNVLAVLQELASTDPNAAALLQQMSASQNMYAPTVV